MISDVAIHAGIPPQPRSEADGVCSTFPYVPLGILLKQRTEFTTVLDEQVYKRCRAQVRAQGVVLRDTVLGSEIKIKKQQVCRSDDFLVAEIDAKVGGFGIVPPELDGAIVSSHYFLFEICKTALDPSFLGFAVRTKSFQSQVSARGSTNYASIRPKHVLGYQIPLPPLPEQRAIAHVLRTVQRAKEATERVIAATRELKRSLMRHLFTYGPVSVGEADRVPLKETEIGLVPEHWEVVKLGSVAAIGNGSTPKRTNSAYWDGGTIPWLTSGKVHEAIIRQADELVTQLACKECHLPLVPRGSLVVAITGQGKTLGNAAILALDATVNQHLAYLQFRASHMVPEFVLAYLRHRYEDLRRASQAGGSTKGALTCGFLATYPLPVPPVAEQREVACVLSAVDHKIEVEERRQQALDTLFRTLLDNLMTGKVRVTQMEAAVDSRVEVGTCR